MRMCPSCSQPQVLDSSAAVVTLPHLKAWTSYCVSVQSRDDYYNKNSSFTTPRCMQTEGNVVNPHFGITINTL